MPRPYYEPGRYWAKLVDQKLGNTSNNNPQVVLTFQILGRMNPSDPDGDLLACEQYERSIFMVFTDKTIEFRLKDLAELGFHGESFGELDLTYPNAHDLRGKEIALFCSHEEYEGQQRERWGLARASMRPEVQPLDAKEIRKLDSLFGRQLRQQARKAKTEEPPPETQTVTTPADSETTDGDGDEVPF